MKAPLLETLTKAAQTADFLASDVREAHSQACGENPALEILLRDLIADAAKLENRLAEIEACFK
jgi:hypothetical protein